MTLASYAELATFAGRSYCGPWSGRVALDCEYDLLPRADELIVVMPGTNPADVLDWLRDLSAWPGNFPVIGLCHAGFGQGATALAERVEPVVKGDRRLKTVVGHSLGGAEALLLGARLVAAAHRVRVVTFGAPRVALISNFALGRLVAHFDDLAEFRRAGDPVPTVPPRPLYKHESRGIALGCAVSDPIANHAIALYAADLAAMKTAA